MIYIHFFFNDKERESKDTECKKQATQIDILTSSTKDFLPYHD